MTTLENYLRGPYLEDKAFHRRLLSKIQEVIPIFYEEKEYPPDLVDPKVIYKSGRTWPYVIAAPAFATKKRKAATTKGPISYSASTHCMIMYALDAFASRGKDEESSLLGRGFRPPGLSKPASGKKMREAFVEARNYLIATLNKWPGTGPLVKSSTYGKNDPFTLTWLTELVYRWWPESAKLTADLEVCRKVLKSVDLALKRPSILDSGGTKGDFRGVTGSFLKVRRLHLAKAAERLARKVKEPSGATDWLKKSGDWKEFDSIIHHQLSYSAMKDPKFDAAELAFAFEGALLLQNHWISRSTVNKIFEALALSDDRQPYWRPVMPFLANDRGQVLFLVSVEVANSILRSFELLGQDETVPIRFDQIEPQLRTYAGWLLGEVQRVRGKGTDGKDILGWKSEYVEQRDTIHLWHTSHVLLFLAHYESRLRKKIGEDGIEAAGLAVRSPKKLEEYWNDEPLQELATVDKKKFAVLARAKNDYVDRRLGVTAKADPPRSILLYGPPGTGKTTLAEQMASSLKRPLIQITVSDFLAAGTAELENRAKGVFRVLHSLEDVVILFDEIDQFLLDRNSEFYKQQSDVFKFMTPGMLTKLQDLRDGDGSVFVIATNYFERIDSAIKRRGRIDDHLLLCLPDSAQRLNLLSRFVHKLVNGKLENKEDLERFDAVAKPGSPEHLFLSDVRTEGGFPSKVFSTRLGNKDVVERTVHFGFGDLKGLVENTRDSIQPGMTYKLLGEALAEAAKEIEPSTSLEAYTSRFEGMGPHPFEEFSLLLYLIAESGRRFTDAEILVMERVLGNIDDFGKDSIVQLLGERGIEDASLRERISVTLSSSLAEFRRQR